MGVSSFCNLLSICHSQSNLSFASINLTLIEERIYEKILQLILMFFLCFIGQFFNDFSILQLQNLQISLNADFDWVPITEHQLVHFVRMTDFITFNINVNSKVVLCYDLRSEVHIQWMKKCCFLKIFHLVQWLKLCHVMSMWYIHIY